MTRRSFFFATTAAATAAAAAAAPRPQNVILILADDLGWSDLGCYGADLHETPHIDALARSSLRFTHAYSASPVCSPTRASIMTGKHPARLGMTIWHEGAVSPPTNRALLPAPSEPNLPHSEITLAELAQERGYGTALIGKWHLGTAPYYPETQGFDINIGGTHWGAPQTFFYPYRGMGRFGGGEYRYIPGLGRGGQDGEYLTDRLTTEALHTIDGFATARRPFFLYLAHHAPHTPIEAKRAMIDKYERKKRGGLRHQNAAYAAMVESFDESVGRVVAHLERRGLDRDTIVVVMSDNGGYLRDSGGVMVTDNAPLRSGKGSLYEGGIRVPLIIHWPGVTRAGSVCAEPVVSTDLFRTLAGAMGAKTPPPPAAPVDGVNLEPVLRDPQARLDRDALYFHYPHYYPTTTPASAIRTREWKLIEYFEDGRLELFDVLNDPGEQRDLAAANPQIAAQLRARLDAWRRAAGARLPKRNLQQPPGPPPTPR